MAIALLEDKLLLDVFNVSLVNRFKFCCSLVYYSQEYIQGSDVSVFLVNSFMFDFLLTQTSKLLKLLIQNSTSTEIFCMCFCFVVFLLVGMAIRNTMRDGRCPTGFTETRRDRSGDGRQCCSGTKARCCMTSRGTFKKQISRLISI